METTDDAPQGPDLAAYRREVRTYCRDVLNGTIPAGRLERLAVRRHLRDLRLASGRGFRFSEAHAAFPIAFFELVLRHSTGEWGNEPFVLEPWQKFILWCVFGWVRIEDGTRRFRFVFEELGRKNGKTAKLAGIGLLLAKFDGEVRAEVYCLATKEKQAKLLFKEAVRMAKRIEEFAEVAKIYEAQEPRIVFTDDDSTFIPLGQDSKGQDGLNPHGVLLDELHKWREHHRETYETMTTGSDARCQPLVWTITTAGDRKSELWSAKRAAAIRAIEEVETGVVTDDEQFAFICEIDEEIDPLRENLDDGEFRQWVESEEFARMMRQANPNLGVSCKVRGLRSAALKARNDPTERNAFLRYHCNRVTSANEKAIRAVLWTACRGELARDLWHAAEPRGGFDLGRSDDFAAATILFPVRTGEFEAVRAENGQAQLVEIVRYEAIGRAWTCEARPERLDTPQFRSWVASGALEVHPGDQVDFTKVTADIAAWSREYGVRSWGYDDTFARMVAQTLQEEHGVEVFPVYQTSRNYNEPVRLFLKLIRDPRRFRHDGDELLAWQADNLGIKKNARDEWMPDKTVSGEKKIDAMVSLLMAYREVLFAERQAKPTYYETHELEVG